MSEKSSLWLLPFYMAVATYFYCKKVRRAMRTAVVSNLLKYTSLSFKYFLQNVFSIFYFQDTVKYCITKCLSIFCFHFLI